MSFVASCGEARADEIDEPENSLAPVIESIIWSGANAIPQYELESRIVSVERSRWKLRFWASGPRLDEFAIADDVDRVVAAYRDHGYFAATAEAVIRPYRVHPESAQPDRVVVEFKVEEGVPTRLVSWTLDLISESGSEENDGSTHIPTPAEREILELATRPPPDGIFGAVIYRERRNALLKSCASMGFLFARISGGANVDPDSHTADVAWSLHLGPRAIAHSINIRGLERVSRDVLIRELRFAKGEVLTSDAIQASENRLIETGLFRAAVIGRPRDGQDNAAVDGNVDLEILIEEAPPRSARASIGYGTEDGPRGELGLTWRNFLGNARTLRLRGFGSFLDVGFEGSLGQPYLFRAPHEQLARGDLAVSALRQDRPGYEAFVTGASGLATFFPDRDGPLRFSIGMGYDLSEILNFAIADDRRLQGPRHSVVVNTFAIARYENVDDVVDPRHGERLTFAHEWGGKEIGSDLDYQLFDLEVRGYRSIGPVTFVGRIRGTTLDPLGGDRSDVPVTRRLYSGGTSSVRGFGFEKLGPEDASNDPVGGLTRLEANAEIRIRTGSLISLVGFVDAGDVRARPFRFRPNKLRASAGPGLRVATPVGPLRLDVGFLLNAPPGTDPWRFHLSVGHAF